MGEARTLETAFACALLLTHCAVDDRELSPNPAPSRLLTEGHLNGSLTDAQTKCVEFVWVTCEAHAQCRVEEGTIEASDLDGTVANCTESTSNVCWGAVRIGPTYDRCLIDTADIPCSEWLGTQAVQPPNSCVVAFE